MDIRLIAFDLDGTLLRSDKSISPRTMQALLAARERGVLLVPSTGRLLRSLPEPLLDKNLTLTATSGIALPPERIVAWKKYPRSPARTPSHDTFENPIFRVIPTDPSLHYLIIV